MTPCSPLGNRFLGCYNNLNPGFFIIKNDLYCLTLKAKPSCHPIKLKQELLVYEKDNMHFIIEVRSTPPIVISYMKRLNTTFWKNGFQNGCKPLVNHYRSILTDMSGQCWIRPCFSRVLKVFGFCRQYSITQLLATPKISLFRVSQPSETLKYHQEFQAGTVTILLSP